MASSGRHPGDGPGTAGSAFEARGPRCPPSALGAAGRVPGPRGTVPCLNVCSSH